MPVPLSSAPGADRAPGASRACGWPSSRSGPRGGPSRPFGAPPGGSIVAMRFVSGMPAAVACCRSTRSPSTFRSCSSRYATAFVARMPRVARHHTTSAARCASSRAGSMRSSTSTIAAPRVTGSATGSATAGVGVKAGGGEGSALAVDAAGATELGASPRSWGSERRWARSARCTRDDRDVSSAAAASSSGCRGRPRRRFIGRSPAGRGRRVETVTALIRSRPGSTRGARPPARWAPARVAPRRPQALDAHQLDDSPRDRIRIGILRVQRTEERTKRSARPCAAMGPGARARRRPRRGG